MYDHTLKDTASNNLPTDTEYLVSVGVASKLLNVHPNTIRLWAKSGKVEAHRIDYGKGMWVFDRRHLRKMAKEGLLTDNPRLNRRSTSV